MDSDDAEVAAAFVRNLREAMGERSLREVAGLAGLVHTTVMRILAGQVWPDLSSIARLERACGASLLPGWEERRPDRAEPPG
jgi:transcriptional regulator with XRE-family HTH domain